MEGLCLSLAWSFFATNERLNSMQSRLKVDLSSALEGLEKLDEFKYALARSMGVAGGRRLRDEAKMRAPVKEGVLRDSIYVVFRDGDSSQTRIKYSVAWNGSKAPHGHLLEFGHWRYNASKNGSFRRSLRRRKGRRVGKGADAHRLRGALEKPVWVPAVPFLRPAYEAILPSLQAIMVKAGQGRLHELLANGRIGRVEE